MKVTNLIAGSVFIILMSVYSFAQNNAKKPIPVANLPKIENVKSSPAYAEVLLRKTELLAGLESLLVEYTEDYPNVKELRYQTGLLQKELDKMAAFNPSESAKLSIALGKLMVRKCELDTDLWSLQQNYNDQQPDVKRAKRKSEIFEAAIKDILQK